MVENFFSKFKFTKRRLLVSASLLLLASTPVFSADKFTSPDIFIIGDSQLSFGAGPVFLDFFQNIKAHCDPNLVQIDDLKSLGEMSVGVIGVRSTSLHSWSAKTGRAKGTICNVDRKWKVNASVYGIIKRSKAKYVQIGQGAAYDFCKSEKSAFESMFRDNYYNPKLLIMSFLGNSAHRWAQNPKTTKRDVERTMKQIPDDLPCIFMTTAPAYKKKTVDLRWRAQKNVKKAFEEVGSRCSFVEGHTPETVKANLGNKSYFRLNKAGRVKDPFHPNQKAARHFFAIETKEICSAVFKQVKGSSFDIVDSRNELKPSLGIYGTQ
ncbi:MAG: hypothetical protein ABJN78_07825 [Hyphomicrobiales bacterium]